MTSSKFKAALSKLNLTQARAAAWLGVDERTVRRWIAGEQAVPKTVAMLIVLTIESRFEPNDVLALARFRALPQ